MDLLKPCRAAEFPARTAAFSGTAASTADWNAGPQGVLVWPDQPCYVVVGNAVTATTGDTPMPANTPMFIALDPNVNGGRWRVSAIAATASAGTVYAKPINRN